MPRSNRVGDQSAQDNDDSRRSGDGVRSVRGGLWLVVWGGVVLLAVGMVVVIYRAFASFYQLFDTIE